MNRSKHVDEHGVLRYDTTGAEVFPGPTGVSEQDRIEREVMLEEQRNSDLIEEYYVRGIVAPDF